jgi:predicted SAM-dependent methyltransferase
MNEDKNIPDHSIFNEDYQITLGGTFKFEMISKIGRIFFAGKPKHVKNSKLNLLNLGCGFAFFDGWVNADFFHLPIKFWKKNQRKTPDWMLDLRYPLNCPDNYWDGVYTEHTLEHLTPAQDFRLFKELYRTMKPGAHLRIIVPNLDKYIQFYNGNSPDKQFDEMFTTGAEALRNVTQNYLHFSTWNAELMVQFCKKAGFSQVKEVAFNQGDASLIIKDTPNRAWESLYIEACK